MKVFEKILIANRGEIAVRILRSTKKLGIKTVCIYTPPDEDSLHVSLADEAYNLGSGDLSDTYLNIAKIIEIAQFSHCEAIHPGYGFLSENPAFAAACEASAIVFIGPHSKAIQSMGNKIEARDFALKAGIPVTAGITGSKENLLAKAHTLIFPVLVKAAAGGGGKGMRIVKTPAELGEALEATSREAAAYFGDGTVYLEKFIEEPRHIEVQVLGDHFGNVIHLFERECSIQRRYQKIIEESPSPTLTPEVRQAICEAAVKVSKAIGYNNAGTIEFLVDKDLNFYFLEMNTRIQVEHPVTEMVTGIDIVEEQLLIASGNPLRLEQNDIQQKGHAIECRIYAEDPANNFMPSPGDITLYRQPEGKDIRVDTGIKSETTIRSFYDPMIAKLIIRGDDREIARHKSILALDSYVIQGIKTNIPYLAALLRHQAFIVNAISTRFCDTHSEEILNNIHIDHVSVSPHIPLFTYLIFSLNENSKGDKNIWQQIGYWRLSDEIVAMIDGKEYKVEILHQHANHIHFVCDDIEFTTYLLNLQKGRIELTMNGVHYLAFASTDKKGFTYLNYEGHTFTCERKDFLIEQEVLSLAGYGASDDKGRITSPMPGKVVKINVKENDKIAKAEVLLVVEAMKMENNITALRDGIVEKIMVKPGDTVDASMELITIKVSSS